MSNIKVKLHKQENNFIQFSISNIHMGLANGIRRILISEIPTMAIDFAEIITNTGCIHDNMIAQRIGLIPFMSHNVDKFDYYWNSDNKNLSEVLYELNVKNDSDSIIDVTSNDLKIIDASKYTGLKNIIYTSVKVIPMEYPIVITKLAEGQSLHFTCSVRKGVSKEHAKFQATTSVGYKKVSVNEYLYSVETVGSLSPSSVVKKALEIFGNKLSYIQKSL